MRPEISVIIPVFKVEKYLRECVDSVLSQTFANFECIVVDDCSPDNCPAICDEYAEMDSRVKVIHNTQNQGQSLVRETGLSRSSGNYILFVDSDDWIEPNMLEKLYGKALDGNYDIVVSNVYYNTSNWQKEYIKPEQHNKTANFKHLVVYWGYSSAV